MILLVELPVSYSNRSFPLSSACIRLGFFVSTPQHRDFYPLNKWVWINGGHCYRLRRCKITNRQERMLASLEGNCASHFSQKSPTLLDNIPLKVLRHLQDTYACAMRSFPRDTSTFWSQISTGNRKYAVRKFYRLSDLPILPPVTRFFDPSLI